MEGRGRGSGRRRAERTGTDMRGGESNGLKRVPQGGVVGKVTPRQKPRHKFGGCNGEKYVERDRRIRPNKTASCRDVLLA